MEMEERMMKNNIERLELRNWSIVPVATLYKEGKQMNQTEISEEVQRIIKENMYCSMQ